MNSILSFLNLHSLWVSAIFYNIKCHFFPLFFKAGSVVTICLMAAIYSKVSDSLYNSCLENNMKEAKELSKKLMTILPLMNKLDLGSNTEFFILKLISNFPKQIVFRVFKNS